ncbi:MAG: sigma-54 dependent transcriptional regulator [Bacteroidota bacterium]|nr:sigma-54 dependent transcriptional regulator [Candidatus Kapabacteria bacterium]MDW8219431.1 sigma-54 dependent transcriptional regulator [Bacteroidota bacterium]
MHTIYVVEDEAHLQLLLEHNLSSLGYTVRIFARGEDCLEELSSHACTPSLVLLDIMLPGMNGVEVLKAIKERIPELPVIILSGQGRIDTAVETIKLGAFDYVQKPLDLTKLEITVRNAIHVYALTNEVKKLSEESTERIKFANIIAVSDTMQSVFKLVKKAQNTDIAVLIQGETGTGKELIARALHEGTKRAGAPFVALNCASIPKDLLESEIFGHEKGAFTGAIQRKIGKFEQAHGGTLFLDEIGELDLSLQAKLLRVLQTKQVERVGSNGELIHVDVRIVSATHRNLQEAIKQGTFREDLYYRLASFPIKIPPLRERKEDIPVLAQYFLEKFATRYNQPARTFSSKALRILTHYHWPGNVRELENTIERAVVLAETRTITEAELQLLAPSDPDIPEIPSSPSGKDIHFTSATGDILPMDKIKEQAIRIALEITGGNIQEAAQKLDIGRATLYRMLEKYKIEH